MVPMQLEMCGSWVSRAPALLRNAAVVAGLIAALGCGPAAAPSATAGANPILTLSVNQASNPVANLGWPILMEIGIVGDGGSVVLASAGTTWIDGLRVEVSDASGVLQSWPIQVLRAPEDGAQLALAPDDVASVFAIVPPQDSLSLAAGAFSLRAVFDATGATPSAWQGVTSSAPAVLTLAPPNGAPNNQEFALERMLRATLFSLKGQLAPARAEIEAILAADPGNAGALTFLGDLQENAGQLDDAIDSYQLALLAAAPVGSAAGLKDPPSWILSRNGDLMARRLRAAGVAPAPKITARVMGRGATSTPGIDYVDVRFTNVGAVHAVGLTVDGLASRVLQGAGTIALAPSGTAALPASLGGLAPGGTADLRVLLAVDSGVARYVVVETGTVRDLLGNSLGFSFAQGVLR
jgi:hypothetical protein